MNKLDDISNYYKFETLDKNSISNSLTLIGDWKISLDVPEKMYFPIS